MSLHLGPAKISIKSLKTEVKATIPLQVEAIIGFLLKLPMVKKFAPENQLSIECMLVVLLSLKKAEKSEALLTVLKLSVGRGMLHRYSWWLFTLTLSCFCASLCKCLL